MAHLAKLKLGFFYCFALLDSKVEALALALLFNCL